MRPAFDGVVYLTVREPFVIGASCAWCLSSALIVTATLPAATPAGAAALEWRGA